MPGEGGDWEPMGSDPLNVVGPEWRGWLKAALFKTLFAGMDSVFPMPGERLALIPGVGLGELEEEGEDGFGGDVIMERRASKRPKFEELDRAGVTMCSEPT